MYKPEEPKSGSLEVICGPMFSGKSEELIRRVRRAMIAKKQVAVFKHALDQRSAIKGVVSHNGMNIQAIATNCPKEIHAYIESHPTDIVGIDEVQFFENEIILVICALIDMGKKVIVSGLDLDFRGVPFGPVPTLLAIADKTLKLRAICTECGVDAHFSQRLINGYPAKHNDPIVLVGAQEAYQARCRHCYQIDKTPELYQL